MRSTATIKCRCCRTLEDCHVLNIVRVDCRDSVSEVVTTCKSCASEVGIIQWNSVNHIKRLVVSCHLSVTTKKDASRSRRTTCCLIDDKTCDLTGKRVDYICLFCLVKFVTFDLRQSITESLAVSLDTQSCNNYLIKSSCVFSKDNLHSGCSHYIDVLVTETRN